MNEKKNNKRPQDFKKKRDNRDRKPGEQRPARGERRPNERGDRRSSGDRNDRRMGEKGERRGNEYRERKKTDTRHSRPREQREDDDVILRGPSIFGSENKNARRQPVKLQEGEDIRVAITHGDFNGIGYEVIMKSFRDVRMLDYCTPIVYGTSKLASYHRKSLGLSDFNFNVVKAYDQVRPQRTNLLNFQDQELKIELGRPSEASGQMAFKALELAIDDLKENKAQVLVTAPINKKCIQSSEFDFPGHTEYLAHKFDSKDVLMIMVSNNIRIGVVTGHIPITKVAETLTEELILKKIRLINHSLKRDFGIRKPKIALLGLNPHAGDDGVIGDEEKNVIIPAIEKAFQNDDILCFGPFPADGFFGSSEYNKYDAILAMYHDQGLIPFKTLSFDNGVNFTTGLPIVRTSPGHGTAYEIAGKDLASPESFREALYLGLEIYRNRNEYDELNANPMKDYLRETRQDRTDANVEDIEGLEKEKDDNPLAEGL